MRYIAQIPIAALLIPWPGLGQSVGGGSGAFAKRINGAVHVVTDKAGFNAAMRAAVGGDIVDLSGVTLAKVALEAFERRK
jgi:hypothetical protein